LRPKNKKIYPKFVKNIKTRMIISKEGGKKSFKFKELLYKKY